MKETRRNFLKAGVTTVAAGAAMATGLELVTPIQSKASSAEHPYGYIPLDVETSRQLGYDGYKGIMLEDGKVHKHCAFASFNAIIGQLAKAAPDGPYAQIPTQMMEWAAGGAAGFATLCGTLNGACAAIGLICDNSSAKLFVSDLLSWYAQTPLPTNIVAPTGDLPQSVARGNLCHMSVTNWCLESGYASGSPERSERCARIAGDVVAMTVEMLNNGALGLTVPGDKTGCRACHHKGTDYEGGQFTRGKMDCTACHRDQEHHMGELHDKKEKDDD